MKIYRFMSIEELNKLLAGVELVNESKHKGSRTSSEGFCFLPSLTVVMVDDYSEKYLTEDGYEPKRVCFAPHKCLSFLSGIVSEDALVEFETTPNSHIKTSWGTYADPTTDEWGAYIDIVEYCSPSYSRETLTPVKYALYPSEYEEPTWKEV